MADDVLGELKIAIRAQMDKLPDDFKAVQGKVLNAAGTIAKGAAGIIAGGMAAAGAAIAGLGKAAFDAAMDIDSAFDTIAIKTGTTGEVLNGLQDDFKAVFTSVPTDVETASAALSMIYDRTGLTGDALQGLTRQMLELARITGGDATTTAENYTQVLADWGINTEDASAMLDTFFVASQKAGVGVDDLMAQVVQFGAPLRTMGFRLKDSVAMFAKWQKEGVNTTQAMSGLRIATAKFADEGKPVQESLWATIDAIQSMEDPTQALSLALDVFGARAGPVLADAIRQGRFGIDELKSSMEGAEGAILNTAQATMDWPEKLEMVKNKITTALEPIGSKLMDVASTVIDKLQPALDRLGPFIETTVAPAFDHLADAIIRVSEGDIEGGIAALFGDAAADPGAAVTAAVGDLANAIGGIFASALRGVFGLPENVDETASGIEQMLQKAAYKVGQAIPKIAGEIGRGFVTNLFGGGTRAATAAEITLPSEPQPFGQGAGIAVDLLTTRLTRQLGFDKLANASARELAGYIENIWKGANDEARRGLVEQLAEAIDTTDEQELLKSLRYINDPQLRADVAQYLSNYMGRDALEVVANNLQQGIPEIASGFTTASSGMGKDAGEIMAFSMNTSFQQEMMAEGILGSAADYLQEEVRTNGVTLGQIMAQAMQGQFVAEFGGWQPPQLQIGQNGMMPMAQAVPTPTATNKTVIIQEVNFYGVQTGYGQTIVNELSKRGYW